MSDDYDGRDSRTYFNEIAKNMATAAKFEIPPEHKRTMKLLLIPSPESPEYSYDPHKGDDEYCRICDQRSRDGLGQYVPEQEFTPEITDVTSM